MNNLAFYNIPGKNILLIAGESGSGKTTYLQNLIKKLQQDNESVDGIIAPKVFDDQINWHQKIVRIKTAKSFDLNIMEDFVIKERLKLTDNYFKFGKFYFDKRAFDWGCEQLLSSMSADCLIIDEIGPLEFLDNGFAPILSRIINSYKGRLIIASRPSLVEKIKLLFN